MSADREGLIVKQIGAIAETMGERYRRSFMHRSILAAGRDAALQYLSVVAAQEQTGCAHFSAFLDAICYSLRLIPVGLGLVCTTVLLLPPGQQASNKKSPRALLMASGR